MDNTGEIRAKINKLNQEIKRLEERRNNHISIRTKIQSARDDLEYAIHKIMESKNQLVESFAGEKAKKYIAEIESIYGEMLEKKRNLEEEETNLTREIDSDGRKIESKRSQIRSLKRQL